MTKSIKEEYGSLIESIYYEYPRLNSKSALRDIIDQKTYGELDCTKLDILLDMFIARVNNPQAGEVFYVVHQRKGSFIARFEDIGEEWIKAVIVSGVAKAIMDYNVKYEGEEITMRRSMIYYYPIKEVTNPNYVKKARGAV